MKKFHIGDYVRCTCGCGIKGKIKHVGAVSMGWAYDVECLDAPLGTVSILEDKLELAKPDGISSGYGLEAWLPTYSEPPQPIFAKKCECGCASIGVNNHSDYCPLFTRE